MNPQLPYGPIEPTPAYLERLHHHVHPSGEQKKAGYILHQLSATDLQRKQRCEKCCKALKKERKRKPDGEPRQPTAALDGAATPQNGPDIQRPTDGTYPVVTESQSRIYTGQESSSASKLVQDTTRERTSPDASFICKYHPGRVEKRKWTCCNGPPFSQPCTGQSEHSPRQYKADELEKNWKFYETEPSRLSTHVAAVVLDCEMGTASSGESELIRISMVDFFSGAILIDSLVYPSVKMAHYNTRFSGVTRKTMEEARRRRKCLLGRDAARQAVYKFVGTDTVVVGHAGHQDLTSLRWTHPRVVDTLILETRKRRLEEDAAMRKEWAEPANSAQGEPADPKAVAKEEDGNNMSKLQEGGLSLKALALKRLNRVIQVKGRGHDSLEDALATRDLLHWHNTSILQPDSEGL